MNNFVDNINLNAGDVVPFEWQTAIINVSTLNTSTIKIECSTQTPHLVEEINDTQNSVLWINNSDEYFFTNSMPVVDKHVLYDSSALSMQYNLSAQMSTSLSNFLQTQNIWKYEQRNNVTNMVNLEDDLENVFSFSINVQGSGDHNNVNFMTLSRYLYQNVVLKE